MIDRGHELSVTQQATVVGIACGATIKVRDSVNQDENAPGVG
jgi:hypothetical protein